MGNALKYAGYGAGGVFGLGALVIGGGFVYFTTAFPNAGPTPDFTIDATPERLERGEYLVEHVAACVGCHSKRDMATVGHPVAASDVASGGFIFDRAAGVPGVIPSRNITPAAMGDWSDGELLHAVTTGVTPDGRALFPIMPWANYGTVSEEDMHAMLAYIRTLEPIDNDVPDRTLDPPMSFIVNVMPQPAQMPATAPDRSDTVATGEYLLNMASCNDCHTQSDHGEPLPGMHLAGGMEFPIAGYGISRAANITPHEASGIGSWSRERFIGRFKVQLDQPIGDTIEPGGFVTVMPWVEYAGMTEEDLGAIYDYLMTVEPVDHSVQRFELAEGLSPWSPEPEPISKALVGAFCDAVAEAGDTEHAEGDDPVHSRAQQIADDRGITGMGDFFAQLSEQPVDDRHPWLHEHVTRHGLEERCSVLTAAHEAEGEGEAG